MQLITRNASLERNLLRCSRRYDNIAFATAWASADTSVFKSLLGRRHTIRQAVIGIHFYQTHPDVLDEFVRHNTVRFMPVPSGIFSPKGFRLLECSGMLRDLVGSANLTKGALGSNSEAVVLASHADAGCSSLKDDLRALIDGYWHDAEPASRVSAKAYREVWKLRQPVLQRLSGQYGKGASKKSPVSSSTMSMSWRAFYNEVRKDKEHDFQERCDLLDIAREAFEDGQSLRTMEPGLRHTIAGLPTDYDRRWGWFGSMRGNGKYYAAVNRNDIHLSQALDVVPLEGIVTRGHSDA